MDFTPFCIFYGGWFISLIALFTIPIYNLIIFSANRQGINKTISIFFQNAHIEAYKCKKYDNLFAHDLLK